MKFFCARDLTVLEPKIHLAFLLFKSDVHLNERYINNEDNDVNYYGDNENNDNYNNHLEIYDDENDNGDDNSDNNDNQTVNA